MRLFLFAVTFLFLQIHEWNAQDFGEQHQLSINHGYRDLLSIDLDLDGDIDQVTANVYRHNISWLSNDGSANYGQEEVLFELDTPRNLEQLDVNGDGFLDLVVVSETDGIFWAQNDGTHHFAEIHLLSGDVGATTLRFADIDLDGDFDIVAAFPQSDDVRLYHNDGAGSYSIGTVIEDNINNVSALDCVDLNGDNFPDVTCSGNSSNASVLLMLNNGDGSFANPVLIPFLAENPSVLDHADIDNDGDLDIIMASRIPNVSWAENSGDGNFFAIHELNLNGYLGVAPTDMSIADLNNDGFVEIATIEDFVGQFRVQYYENHADGTFGYNHIISMGICYGIGSVEIGDVDGDGWNEIIKCSVQADEIGYYQNNEFLFNGFLVIVSDVADNVSNPVVFDIDGDLDLDVLVCNYTGGGVTGFYNDGEGNFSSGQVLSTAVTSPSSVLAEDMDNDGDKDLLIVSEYNNFLYLLPNLGGGNFGSPVNIIENPNSVMTIDADQDQDLDIVVSTSEDSQTILLINDGLQGLWEQIVLLDGSSDFQAGDIDGDGDDDIVGFTGFSNGTCILLRNNGLTQFVSETMATNLPFSDLRNIEDIDDNGSLDIVITTHYGTMCSWMPNNGLGNFGELQPLEIVNNSPGPFLFVDMDLDGDRDILAPSHPNLEGFFSYFEKTGPNQFFTPIYFPTPPTPYGQNDNGHIITTGDLNGDLHPDIVFSFEYSDEVGWMENTTFNGCTDPLACNYSSGNSVDDGSCCYGICGCSDPLANNYNPNVDCSDPGICTYLITGTVYFDENESGQMNFNESGISNEQVILDGIISQTNESGNFTYTLSPGYHVINKIPSLELPNITSSDPVNFLVNPGSPLPQPRFGVSDETPDLFFNVHLSVHHYSPSLPCDSLFEYRLRFIFYGQAPVTAVIELEFDTLFQSFEAPFPVDSIIGNIAYMTVLTGNGLVYDVPFTVHTPEAEYFGEALKVDARINGYYLNEVVVSQEDSFTSTLACSYDPNMKQAIPVGYTDEHYFLPDDPIEYKVHFQNTGNAPATNVLIRDTLDAQLDLSTFELSGYSHSVITTMFPETRVIEFYFQNILLPDSINDEPNSHGVVSYTIRPYSNLEAGTVISNTALIYFDNNPPIITNTTWHTVYYCSSNLSEIEGEMPDQVGESFTLSNTQDLIESYTWSLNGEEIGSGSTLNYTLQSCGENVIHLEVANPFCVGNDSIEVYFPFPEASFEQSIWVLNANPAEAWQWYLNGTAIEGAIDQTYVLSESGDYSVEVFNEFGCGSMSQSVYILYISILELEQKPVLVYPNPMLTECRLIIDVDQTYFPITIINNQGAIVDEFIYQNKSGHLINRGNLSAGQYYLTFDVDKNKYVIPLIVE